MASPPPVLPPITATSSARDATVPAGRSGSAQEAARMTPAVTHHRHLEARPAGVEGDPRATRIAAWIQAGTYPLHPQIASRRAADGAGHSRTVTGAGPAERCVVCANLATVRYAHLDPILTLCQGCLVLWVEGARGEPGGRRALAVRAAPATGGSGGAGGARSCSVPANDVEELSGSPRVPPVSCRCPRCAEVASRRQVGMPAD
jgi:hypothetical protein